MGNKNDASDRQLQPTEGSGAMPSWSVTPLSEQSPRPEWRGLEALEPRLLLDAQVITPEPALIQVDVPPPQPVDFVVKYSTDPADQKATGLGFKMHWDSSKLGYPGDDPSNLLTDVYQPGLLQLGDPEPDDGDLDNDPDTDMRIMAAWMSVGGDWPPDTLPIVVYSVHFVTTPTFTSGSTRVNFSDETAAGFDFESTSLVVEVVGNVPPALSNIEAAALDYTENDPAVAVTSQIAVSDADDTNLESATIAITAGYQQGEDLLEYSGPLASNWDPDTGTLTLTGTAPVADYQAALRAVTYRNTSDDPSTAPRTVCFTVNDGQDDSNTVCRQVTVTAVNDVPVLTTNSGLTVGKSQCGVIDRTMLEVTDPDNTPDELTYTLETAPVHGVLKVDDVEISAGDTFTQAQINAGLLCYCHDDSDTDTDSFVFTVADGAGGSIGPAPFGITIRAKSQVITPVPGEQVIHEGGVADIAVNYSTEPPNDKTTGLGFRMHWDSSFLGYLPLTGVYQPGLLQQGVPEPDVGDLDNDPATDMRINVAWMSVAGDWPPDDLPIVVYNAHFRGEQVGETFVNFSDDTAAGYTFDWQSAKIVIEPRVNRPPVAVDDPTDPDDPAYQTGENDVLQLPAPGVVANDFDPDGDPISVDPAGARTSTKGAQVTVNADGSFGYDPNTPLDSHTIFDYLPVGAQTTDTFTYYAYDGDLHSLVPATVTVTILGRNDVPVLVTNAGLRVGRGLSAMIDRVRLEVTDVDNTPDELTYTLETAPSHGVLKLDGVDLEVGDKFTQKDINDGDLTYQHDGSFTDEDSFGYTVDDGDGGSIASTTFPIDVVSEQRVAPTPPDPAVRLGCVVDIAVNYSTEPPNDKTTGLGFWMHWNSGMLGYPDDDPDNLLTDVYQSDLLQVGDPESDVVEDLDNDPNTDMRVKVAWADLTGQNWPPDDLPIVVYNAHFKALQEGVTSINFSDDTAAGYTFAWTAAEVTILPNHPPVAVDDPSDPDDPAYRTGENDVLHVPAPGVLANDFDPDGDPVSVDPAGARGSDEGADVTVNADGSFTYDPGSLFDYLPVGAQATDTFRYYAYDGCLHSLDPAAVTVAILGQNDTPQPEDDQAATDEDTVIDIDVLANDSDPDVGDKANWTLSLPSATSRWGVPLTIVGNKVRYDPRGVLDWMDEGEILSPRDDFEYTVTDAAGASAQAIVYVDVTGVNDVPVANDDQDDTDEDTAIDIDVLANDVDVDHNDELHVKSVDPESSMGVPVTINPDGTVHYNPAGVLDWMPEGRVERDLFGYVVADTHDAQDDAVVEVEVTGVNDPPVANDDAYEAWQNHVFYVSADDGLLANDTDVDLGAVLTVASVDTSGLVGKLLWQPDGSFAYNPDGQFDYLKLGETAQTSFSYTVADEHGATDTADVVITVKGNYWYWYVDDSAREVLGDGVGNEDGLPDPGEPVIWAPETDRAKTEDPQGHTLVYMENVFPTIQEGIDAAGSGGLDPDTGQARQVLIAPGLYAEEVTINAVPLSLEVIGFDPPGSSVHQTMVMPGPDQAGFVIQTGGRDSDGRELVLRNLNIVNGQAGVLFDGSAGTVDNVTLDPVRITGAALGGVVVDDGAVVSDLTLDHVQLVNNRWGLYVAPSGVLSGLEVTRSLFDGNTMGIRAEAQPGEDNSAGLTDVNLRQSIFVNNAAAGIYVQKLSNAVMEQLVVVSNGNALGHEVNVGIGLDLRYGDYTDILLSSSYIADNGLGDALRGVGVEIKARDDGIFASQPATVSNVRVVKNIITGNNFAGLRFGQREVVNAGMTGLVVNQNDLSGNLANIGLVNRTTFDIDARGNWWGRHSGPIIVGPNDLSNPGGSGAVAQVYFDGGDVLFSPWLISGDRVADQVGDLTDPENVDQVDWDTIGLQRYQQEHVYATSFPNQPADLPFGPFVSRSLAENDYRHLANAIGTAFDGQEIILHGNFDWSFTAPDTFAYTAWANGVDGNYATLGDNYTIATQELNPLLADDGNLSVNNVTIKASQDDGASVFGGMAAQVAQFRPSFLQLRSGHNVGWQVIGLSLDTFYTGIEVTSGSIIPTTDKVNYDPAKPNQRYVGKALIDGVAITNSVIGIAVNNGAAAIVQRSDLNGNSRGVQVGVDYDLHDKSTNGAVDLGQKDGQWVDYTHLNIPGVTHSLGLNDFGGYDVAAGPAQAIVNENYDPTVGPNGLYPSPYNPFAPNDVMAKNNIWQEGFGRADIEGVVLHDFDHADRGFVDYWDLQRPDVQLPSSADENEVVLLSASFDNVPQPHHVKIEWGDGHVDEFDLDSGVFTFQTTHHYADNGEFDVVVTVSEIVGGETSDPVTKRIKVLNVDPRVDDLPDLTVDEGYLGEFTVNCSFTDDAFYDAVLGNTKGWTYTIDWGDGHTDSGPVTDWDNGGEGVPSRGRFKGIHCYADNSINPDDYTVIVTVTDDDGGTGEMSFRVTVLNVPPDLQPLPDKTINEGENLDITVEFSDPAFYDPALGNAKWWAWSVDWGDGSQLDHGTLNWDDDDVDNGSCGVPSEGSFDGSHYYADDGTYRVTVTIRDDDGGEDVGTFWVTVENVKPDLTVVEDQTVEEGAKLVIPSIGKFVDPGFDNPLNPNGPSQETFTYTIDWGDGTVPDEGTVTEVEMGSPGVLTKGHFDGVHYYADDGTYTVEVTVTDDDGDPDTEHFQVIVGNAGPTLTQVDDMTLAEGELHAFLFDWTDPGFDNPGNPKPEGPTQETFTYTVDWGDGSPIVTENDQPVDRKSGSPKVPTKGAVELIHAYPDNGPYTVTVTVTDDDGGQDAMSFEVTVENVAPYIHQHDPMTVDEGQVIIIDRMFWFMDGGFDNPKGPSDTPPNPIGPTAEWFEYKIDWGDGEQTGWIRATDVEQGEPGRQSRGWISGENDDGPHTKTYGDSGKYDVTIWVRDDDDGVGDMSFPVEVNDVPLAITPIGSQVVDEGQELALTVEFSDPGFENAVFTYTVDWGDGHTETGDVTDITPGAPGTRTKGRFDIAHTYADNGAYVATVTVHEAGGADVSQDFGVTVNNVAPTLELEVGNQVVQEGVLLDLPVLASFTDPGFLDSLAGNTKYFLYSVDWGDGFVDTGRLDPGDYANGEPGTETSGQFGGQHYYADDGSYKVTVSIDDDDGGRDIGAFEVTVENADPVLTQPADLTGILEGQQFTVNFDFTDLGFDNPKGPGDTPPNPNGPTQETFTYAIDWGDGYSATGDVTDVTMGSGGVATVGRFSGAHTYADNGTYTVTVTVNDDDLGQDVKTFTVAVENVNPDLAEHDDMTGADRIPVGKNQPFTFTFTDPGFTDLVSGSVESFTYRVDWDGDGVWDEQGPVDDVTPGSRGTPTSGRIETSHAWDASAEGLTVTVQVSDDDGGVDSIDFLVDVGVVRIIGNEGDTFTLPMDLLYYGDYPEVTTWVVRWGDGGVDVFGQKPVAPTHVYDDGTQAYTVTVTRVTATGPITVHHVGLMQVQNLPPQADFLDLSGFRRALTDWCCSTTWPTRPRPTRLPGLPTATTSTPTVPGRSTAATVASPSFLASTWTKARARSPLLAGSPTRMEGTAITALIFRSSTSRLP